MKIKQNENCYLEYPEIKKDRFEELLSNTMNYIYDIMDINNSQNEIISKFNELGFTDEELKYFGFDIEEEQELSL